MTAPQRIVSLVPSLTELAWWLGAGDRLVGRTRFCTEPAGAIESVATVGGTKKLNIGQIVALAPDLVIANKEENQREDVEALLAAGLDVLVTDPNTVDEAIAMVEDLGERLGFPKRAAQLAADTRAALDGPLPARRPRVFVAVWPRPMMGLGDQAYGNNVIERCGAINVLAGEPRYPETSIEALAGRAVDLVLLPDEPYPFGPDDAATFAEVAPARCLDGKLLWWYGPRMPEAITILRALFAEAAE